MLEDKRVTLYILMMGECDPEKCTANKLVKFNLAKPIYRVKEVPRGCVVLNPLADEMLSIKDREIALRHGIIAVDCSWKNAEALFNRVRIRGFHRRLPRLIAVNPINFGNPHILSTVEALAASLYILGFERQGRDLLSIFKWGSHFFEVNKELLKGH
jgi:pre-rRNA-processing protein TSR3